MGYQHIKTHRQLTKERVVYVLGGKCAICGLEDTCLSVYDFHHINPEEKDFTISSGYFCNSWEKLIDELKKGVLLCANCHRRVHSNIENYNLVSTFNQKRADEISQQIENLKKHKNTYCKDCGAIISSGAERCKNCDNVVRRIVERPEREKLKEIIRTKPFTRIAFDYKVSDNAIRRWCDSYCLPRTKKEINSYSDEEWELL